MHLTVTHKYNMSTYKNKYKAYNNNSINHYLINWQLNGTDK